MGNYWEFANRTMVRRAATPEGVKDSLVSPDIAGKAPNMRGEVSGGMGERVEKLASRAPRPMSGQTSGGASIHAPITIQNNGDPEHTANQAQKRIQDLSKYQTNDVNFESQY